MALLPVEYFRCGQRESNFSQFHCIEHRTSRGDDTGNVCLDQGSGHENGNVNFVVQRELIDDVMGKPSPNIPRDVTRHT